MHGQDQQCLQLAKYGFLLLGRETSLWEDTASLDAMYQATGVCIVCGMLINNLVPLATQHGPAINNF